MRTFTLLKGQPVINLHDGKIIGHVADLQLTPEGKIESIVIDQNSLFGRDQHIPLQMIASIGNDGVMINSYDGEHLVGYNKSNQYLCHGHGIIGQMLLSTEGEKLGIVEDVYFDENLGTIIGYEVSEGFFADITEGKKVVKSSNPLQFGQDTILIEIDS